VILLFPSIELGRRTLAEMWSAPSHVNRSARIKAPISYALGVELDRMALLAPSRASGECPGKTLNGSGARSPCGSSGVLAAEL
jgi:hypothetical protein